MAAVTTPQAGRLPSPSLPPATGRAGLVGALRSEWTKIRTVRSTYWTLIAFMLVSIGLGAAITAGAAADLNAHPARKAEFDATAVSLVLLFYLGELVIAVLGAMVITSEYSTGMIRTSLTVQPRRGLLYGAKALVFAAVALVISMVTAFAAFFVGQALLSGTGVSATLSTPHALQAVIGSALLVSLAAMLAYGLGGILRHTAATIATSIGLLFVVPIIVSLLPDSWRQDIVRWLPTSAGEVMVNTVGQMPPNHFSVWPQFAVTAAWALTAVIAGGILFRKRDA